MDQNEHKNVLSKLDSYLTTGRIPNLLFVGKSGSGKSYVVDVFLRRIYCRELSGLLAAAALKENVMYVNCAHGKGIRFIRDELKMFMRMRSASECRGGFKTVVLFNGDYLSLDAQAALRRCIEVYSHNTRFILLAEDKDALIMPIQSRFCEIYMFRPKNEYGHTGSLYTLHGRRSEGECEGVIELLEEDKRVKDNRVRYLQTELREFLFSSGARSEEGMELVERLYEKAYCISDFIRLIEMDKVGIIRSGGSAGGTGGTGCAENVFENMFQKYNLLVDIVETKKVIRNEKLLMLFVLERLMLLVAAGSSV